MLFEKKHNGQLFSVGKKKIPERMIDNDRKRQSRKNEAAHERTIH